MMDKVLQKGHILLSAMLVVAGVALILPWAGYCQSVTPPKQGRQDGIQDNNLVNCTKIRKCYHDRYPFAKKAEEMTIRDPWTDYPKYTVQIGDNTKGDDGDGNNAMITIPPGETLMKKAHPESRGDLKAPGRPQYWPLIVPCGSPTGWFLPPTPSVIMSSSSLPPKYPNPVTVTSQTAIPCYSQPYLFDMNKGKPAQARDDEIWEYELTTFGVGPISDTQFQAIDREDNQRFLELAYDPERWMWVGKAMGDEQRQGMSNSVAGAAEATFSTAVNMCEDALINVANENAAIPCNGSASEKTVPEAVYMVQQMYKYVYIPMAILFLLPGAIMTQMKGMVVFGMLGKNDEDSASPFSGILRSIIAVFLIPATQLFVSYAIDIGNSMTYEVKRYVNNQMLFDWSHEQTYNPPVDNSRNTLQPPETFPEQSSEADQREEGVFYTSMVTAGKYGKGSSEVKEERSEVEKATNLSQIVQLGFNVMNFLMGNALVVLTSFQLVMMCYLFLMGPISACLFAWPAGVGGVFKKVFTNWVDAVTILALWRFWWMVVLACMCTRVAWLKESGMYTPNTQWEMYMFTCFMGLLMYVPFQPFEFKPGEAAAKVLEEGSKAANLAGGAAGKAAKAQGMSSGAMQQAQQDLSHATDQAHLVSSGMTGQSTGLFADRMPPSADPQQQQSRDRDSQIRDRSMPSNLYVNVPPSSSGNVETAPHTAHPVSSPPPTQQQVVQQAVAPKGSAPISLAPRGPQTVVVNPSIPSSGSGNKDHNT